MANVGSPLLRVSLWREEKEFSKKSPGGSQHPSNEFKDGVRDGTRGTSKSSERKHSPRVIICAR